MQTVSEQEGDESQAGRPALLHVAVGAAVAASWLILRPYYGVIHDTQLYFHFAEFGGIDAFQRLDVAVANDRQMSRSLFVKVLEPIVAAFGIAQAAIMLTVLGLVGWVASLVALARTLVGRDWWVVVIAVPAFSGYWGPLFLIAEPFATPRVFAEAMVIAAIALALNRHTPVAVAVAGASIMLHPIIGLSGVAVVLVIVAIERPSLRGPLVVAAVVGIAVAVLDPIGIGGASSFSAPWLSIIAERASLVLPDLWPGYAWVRTAFGGVMVVALMLTSREAKVRSLSIATLIVASAGLTTSIIFSWIWVRPFVTQLQPWRTLWILHLVAIIAVVIFSISAFRVRDVEGRLRALASWCLVLGLVTVDAAIWSAVIVVLLAPLILPHGRVVRRLTEAPRFVPAFGIVVATIAGLQILVAAVRVIAVDSIANIPWLAYATHLPASSLLVAAVLIGAVLLATTRTRGAVATLLILLVLTFGVVTWDHRSAFESFAEANTTAIIELPDDAVVLVEHDSIAVSTLLRRPAYYSGNLGAGVVFSEPLALEYNHHAELARSLGIPFALDYRLGEIPHVDVEHPSKSAAAAACSDPRGPSHLLLRRAIEGKEGTIWHAPVPLDDVPQDETNPAFLDDAFVLYVCSDLLDQ